MFALILLSPTMSYSFQAGNHSVRHPYTIGIEMPSHQPAVVVTRVPYSLKYEALFQPEAMEIGKTATSSLMGRTTSANITPVRTKTFPSIQLPSLGRPITSPTSNKFVVKLTNNMTTLNLTNKMIAGQARNMTVPSIPNSSFKVTSPTNISALK
jgi:hypothetical protein